MAVFLGLIYGAPATGHWATSSGLDAEGNPLEVSSLNPDEIKGWMTVGDIATAYRIPREQIYEKYNIPSGTPAATPLKELSKVASGFSTEEFKTWVKERLSDSGPPE